MSIIVTSWQTVHLTKVHDYEMGLAVEQYSALGFEVKAMAALDDVHMGRRFDILMQRPISWVDAGTAFTYPS